jgi:hypothetical protein
MVIYFFEFLLYSESLNFHYLVQLSLVDVVLTTTPPAFLVAFFILIVLS